MPEMEITFGLLTLNRDTIVRLDSEMQNESSPNAKNDRTKEDCPKSTKTKVTAHCC